MYSPSDGKDGKEDYYEFIFNGEFNYFFKHELVLVFSVSISVNISINFLLTLTTDTDTLNVYVPVLSPDYPDIEASFVFLSSVLCPLSSVSSYPPPL